MLILAWFSPCDRDLLPDQHPMGETLERPGMRVEWEENQTVRGATLCINFLELRWEAQLDRGLALEGQQGYDVQFLPLLNQHDVTIEWTERFGTQPQIISSRWAYLIGRKPFDYTVKRAWCQLK